MTDFDFLGIKFNTASPLAMQVYELGVCAQCHQKTMRFIHSGADMQFWQCTVCKVVAILPDNGPAVLSSRIEND